MATQVLDRIKETSTTTGTGTITLNGPTVGYRPFSTMANGDTTFYTIWNLDVLSEWEVGLGTYNLGTLARTTVLSSSNGGGLVIFSAGAKEVWGDAPAYMLDNLAYSVQSLANLKTLPIPLTAKQTTVVTQYYSTPGDLGGGTWTWRGGDQSANVTADAQSAIWAAPTADTTGASGAWERSYDGKISVRWFGAKGDGTTDDTTALQAAIDYCGSDSSDTTAFGVKPLFFNQGDYLIMSPLVINHVYNHWEGASWHSSRIIFTGVAGGCITAAALAQLQADFSHFSIVGDSSSGNGIDLTNVSGDVYHTVFDSIHIVAGGNGLHIPNNIFSSAITNCFSSSINGHSFLLSCGPAVDVSNCYAVQCGNSKAGYRMAGNICLIACNGLSQGDFWGVFGSDTGASDGFQNDFSFTNYAAVTMIDCNVEDWASGAGHATASGIYLQNGYRKFQMIGGTFQRGAGTSYHSVVRATGASFSGGFQGINLSVSGFGPGPGAVTSYLYTNALNIFVDNELVLSNAGVTTFFVNNDSSTRQTLRPYAQITSTVSTAQTFNGVTADLAAFGGSGTTVPVLAQNTGSSTVYVQFSNNANTLGFIGYESQTWNFYSNNVTVGQITSGTWYANNGTPFGTKTTATNGAAASTGTLTNAPVAGNPTKWIPFDDNGTTRYIPCW